MKELFNYTPTEKDFPEEFQTENGCYENTCVECKNTFMGNKHRILCKQCLRKALDTLKEP
jgi:hypothetical protein